MTSVARYLGLIFVFGSSAAATAQVTRDSAGIRIVENSKPAWAPGREWRLSENPILVLGDGNAVDDRLGRIVGVTRLSDGRVVVADQSTLQLKFFDTSGRRLKSVGGKGQGEDQFRDFRAASRLAGDSIVVDALEKASVFAPSGSFVRSITVGPFPPGALQTPFAATVGRFENGHAIVADFPQGQHAPAVRQWVDSSSLVLVDGSGAVVRSLGKAPAVLFVAGASRAEPMDLGPQAVFASSGRSFYWGFNNEYNIRVYDADGKLQRLIRRSWTPRRLTSREVDDYVDGWLQMWSKKTGVERDAERKEMRGKTYPEFLAPYSAIVATSAGDLWVREPDLTGAPGCWCLAGVSTVPIKWSVFDADGRWLGDVTVPPRFTPLEIGADYVLGRSRAADNVVRAVMYRLDKPR